MAEFLRDDRGRIEAVYLVDKTAPAPRDVRRPPHVQQAVYARPPGGRWFRVCAGTDLTDLTATMIRWGAEGYQAVVVPDGNPPPD